MQTLKHNGVMGMGNLYKRWRCTTMINGARFWATVTADTGTEGEAKRIANKLFSFSAYSDRVQVSPVRSSIINPVPLPKFTCKPEEFFKVLRETNIKGDI